MLWMWSPMFAEARARRDGRSRRWRAPGGRPAGRARTGSRRRRRPRAASSRGAGARRPSPASRASTCRSKMANSSRARSCGAVPEDGGEDLVPGLGRDLRRVVGHQRAEPTRAPPRARRRGRTRRAPPPRTAPTWPAGRPRSCAHASSRSPRWCATMPAASRPSVRVSGLRAGIRRSPGRGPACRRRERADLLEDGLLERARRARAWRPAARGRRPAGPAAGRPARRGRRAGGRPPPQEPARDAGRAAGALAAVSHGRRGASSGAPSGSRHAR